MSTLRIWGAASLITLIFGWALPPLVHAAGPVAVFVSPKEGTFEEGAEFEVSFYLDTGGQSVNGIELNVRYDSDKLAIAKPSVGESIVTQWLDPPGYSNQDGFLSISGIVTSGIKTDSGLILSAMFKALSPGRGSIRILSTSKILANDGKGTELKETFRGAELVIAPKTPPGPVVSSPGRSETEWSNNPNLVLAWTAEPGAEGFSYELDGMPATVPDNTVDTVERQKSYEDLKDGLWFFHVKQLRNGVWGEPSHFPIRLDRVAPAEFVPEVKVVESGTDPQALVFFFTTDIGSGLEKYEVALVPENSGEQGAVFVLAESPYTASLSALQGLKMIVRATDRVGNVRDAVVSLPAFAAPPFFTRFLADRDPWFYVSAFLAALFVGNFFFGRRLVRMIFRRYTADRVEDLVRMEQIAEMVMEARARTLRDIRHPEQFALPPPPPPPAIPGRASAESAFYSDGDRSVRR